MQPTAPAATDPASAQRRTLRLAWLTLSVFFALFLALLLAASLGLRQLYLGATDAQAATLIVRGSAEGLTWQPAGRTIFQGVSDQQPIGEGETLRALPSAGYGQVATLRLFDASQLDLWAGAELRVGALRTSRWHTATQQVDLAQSAGYVRYDLRADQPFRSVRYTVIVGDARVELAPGGSYSIGLRAADRLTLRSDGRPTLIADIAVRSGSAQVFGPTGQRTRLVAGQRLEVDPAGNPGLAVPARWELIRDGGFSLFSELEYNNTTRADDPTLPRSTTWQVSGTPSLPPAERGYLRLSPICRPPQVDTPCAASDRRLAAWFYRTGGQTNGFATSIRQPLGAAGTGVDISEYRALSFSIWARILFQSLPGAGDRGTECPVMIRIVARQNSPADPDEERIVCLYTAAAGEELRARADGVVYLRVEPAVWVNFRVDLRSADWLPNHRFLRSIEIYANGHDYDSRVVDVSLVGTQ